MYMWIPISIRNKVLLYVNWLFANFLVWDLGKVCLVQVFVRVLRFCPLNVIKNSLIKRTNKKSKLYKFYINKYNTKLCILIN